MGRKATPVLLALALVAPTPNALAQQDPPAAGQPGGVMLRLPVPGACISSPFGPRRAVGPHAALFHNGVDLPGPPGTWVVAAAAGQVTAVRRLGSSGLEIDIAHGNGFSTRYAHLGSIAPAIAGGAGRVAAGERIGRIGRSGITYGTHLHFELHAEGKPVDPAPYLQTHPC
jgi:murein DD-endopeptidase MepM/ murein hydrolase activator NlpD